MQQQGPHIAIRTDAFPAIGTGHLMRCLALANKLAPMVAGIHLVGYISDDLLAAKFTAAGHQVYPYPKPLTDPAEDAALFKDLLVSRNITPDLVIVDHYGLEARWETETRTKLGTKIAVIDDLANRPHVCDLLLDQNFYAEQHRYAELVPNHCEQLLGPRFALLRDEFAQALAVPAKEKTDVLVSFGGADLKGHTLRVVHALGQIKTINHATIIIGAMTPDQDSLKLACDQAGYELHIQTNRMAELLRKADTAIIACGSIIWEAGIMGVPAILTSSEPFQERLATDLCNASLAHYIGPIDKLNKAELQARLMNALGDRSGQSQTKQKLQQLMTVDGSFGAEYVAARMAQLVCTS